MKSLKALNDPLSATEVQLQTLELSSAYFDSTSLFQDKLRQHTIEAIRPVRLEIFQLNLGKMCNQTCKHCHVDAGPDRKEIMTLEVMDECLKALDRSSAHTVDLTGGAPEMNPNFRYLVTELSKRGKKIIVRCNLSIILANKKYHDLPQFFKDKGVEVVSSLPYFSAGKTDAQRGAGVFQTSIEAIRMLNAVGYGVQGSGLVLNLVYNPSGAYLAPDQGALEKEFKQRLSTNFQVYFNNLFTITNLPISRYLDYLVRTGNFDSYMHKLIEAFNPAAVSGVMCRNMISVGWDGVVYDCDFNQMLELTVDVGAEHQHISGFSEAILQERAIVVNQHCYGCTAGSGSSCGGTIV